jgi:hypothetical protein
MHHELLVQMALKEWGRPFSTWLSNYEEDPFQNCTVEVYKKVQSKVVFGTTDTYSKSIEERERINNYQGSQFHICMWNLNFWH